jgi:predicted transcriptional regulator
MSPKRQPLDAILPIVNDYMQQIVRREKNHEFRRYRIASSVERVWFYLNAPLSHIEYVCEIDPARTRNDGDEPLPEDGRGNKEFNERHKDWDKYNFAYRVRSVYRLRTPIKLLDMKKKYGIKGAPRGLVYVPHALLEAVQWREQECIWSYANPCLIGNRIQNKRKAEEEATGSSSYRLKKQVSLF